MTIQLGQIAPDFTAETTAGRIRFHDWAGESWVVFFSHPKDFTPVCTTELGEAARLKPEFDKRGTKIIGLSVDALDRHAGWEADIAETQGASVNFPMIADQDRKVSELYGMIHPEADPSVTVRVVYVIDPAKKVRLSLTYPPSTGRNFAEILRVLDSLQLTDKHKVATPVNWQPGQRAIIVPSVSDEQAKERFPQGWEAQKPYLRWVELKDS
ncbi:peroxiredoxin [Pseudoroseomonas cervicalis]|uniref:peroxiredoxin n=1 Tax=Teichococcus cervicalis TaxID=204525 RepID=UPI0022F152BA|nr:peroxiredoxin [Pseudoroseomonas cervicalis]WBV42411.1 peroxiredoxin [Pseudoroseomonas cervicalis]